MHYLTNIPDTAKDYGIQKLLITRSLTIDYKHRGTEMFIRNKDLPPKSVDLLELMERRENQLRFIYHISRKALHKRSPNLANKVPVGYAIQGELIGPKIQANHEKVTELQYYVFDVFNISEQCYLLPQERRDFCHTLGIPHVPVMNVKATPLQLTLDQLLQHVDTESVNPKTVSEGRVYKSNTNPLLSFKVINNRYLLKHEA